MKHTEGKWEVRGRNAEIYVGKNPHGFPYVQIKKEVYNFLEKRWIRQKTCKTVGTPLQNKLTKIFITYYKDKEAPCQ